MARNTISVVRVYGAGILLRNLQAMNSEIAGVRESRDDIEYIHRMRVASRRLRAGLDVFRNWLPGKQADQWIRGVRSITQALGAARDADVQIEHLKGIYKELDQGAEKPGVHRLLVRMIQQRQALHVKVLKTLNRFEKSGIGTAMVVSLEGDASLRNVINMESLLLYRLAHRSVSRGLKQFLSYETYIPIPEEKEKLHAMRIAAKRLRYTLEIFSELFEDGLKSHLQVLRKIQDMLGSIHDDDVWIDWLPGFMEEERQRTYEYYGVFGPFRKLRPGLEYFLNQCQDDREKTYNKFVNEWNNWKDQNAWEALRTAVQVPASLIPAVPDEVEDEHDFLPPMAKVEE